VFDSEAKIEPVDDYEKQTFWLAWTCYLYNRSGKKDYQHKYLEWKDSNSLCEYIENHSYSKKPLYLFAHNIFYDLQLSGFFRYFTKAAWILDFVYEAGLDYILCCHKGDRKIKCISTTNYFPEGLKSLGKATGMEKGKVDFHHETETNISKYCRKDTEILTNIVLSWFDFITIHNLGKFSYTRASQAFNGFRHRFMEQKIYIPKQKHLREFEQQAYYGARTECFRIGEFKGKQFSYLDFNSLYPHVMKSKKYPVKAVSIEENPDIPSIIPLLGRYCFLAECEVITDIPIYPIKYRGKLIFPIGRLKVFLCTEGLTQAIRRNHLIRIIKIVVYEQADIFSKYVDYWYKYKLQYKRDKNEIYYKIVKLLLNSLYGKFGMFVPITLERKTIEFDGYFREIAFHSETKERGIHTKLMNRDIWQFGRKLSGTSFCAISSHVTEYGRFLLWNMIERVGMKNVYYVDTDSIVIPSKKVRRLRKHIDDEKLGYLSLEKEFDYMKLLAPKDYIMGKEHRLKGVPRNAEYIGNETYRFPVFLSQKSHMREQIKDYYKVKYVEKTISHTYSKGIVEPDGRVTPFVFT
jgi:hypothetical protein